MQILINIPEDSYKATCNGCMLPPDVENVVQGIKNGVPLAEGHGRLFDEKDIVSGDYEVIGNRIYELEPIMEADTESEGKE